MNCSACGVELSSEAKFCHKCGELIESDQFGENLKTETSTGDSVSDSSGQESNSIEAAAEKSPTERFKDSLRPRTGDGDDVEHDLWKGGYSGKAMLGSWFIAGFCTVGLLALGIMLPVSGTLWMVLFALILIVWLAVASLLGYRKLNVHYELTTQRFIHREGILKRTTDRIEVIDIDDVTIQQGLIQRLLGVGSIKITSSDASHPELWMHGIAEVQRISVMIDDVRREERRKRGVHIESI